jgi:GTPase SAR1 family protein
MKKTKGCFGKGFFHRNNHDNNRGENKSDVEKAANKTSTRLLVRCLLLGYQGVGKSALSQRYFEDTFPPGNQYSSMIDVYKVIDDQNIWFRLSEHNALYEVDDQDARDNTVIIACYDVNDMESFEFVLRQLKHLYRHCNDSHLFFLVGTKDDENKFGDEARNYNNHLPETFNTLLEKEDIPHITERIAAHITVSAKNGTNIDELFIRVVRHTIEHAHNIRMQRPYHTED